MICTGVRSSLASGQLGGALDARLGSLPGSSSSTKLTASGGAHATRILSNSSPAPSIVGFRVRSDANTSAATGTGYSTQCHTGPNPGTSLIARNAASTSHGSK